MKKRTKKEPFILDAIPYIIIENIKEVYDSRAVTNYNYQNFPILDSKLMKLENSLS